MPEDKLSFIPQKKIAPTFYKEGRPGILMILSFLLFFVSVGAYGGLLFYKNSLQKNIDNLSQSLDDAKAVFELPLINEVNQVSKKINYSKKLLDQHANILPIFDFLEKNTLKKIVFNDFTYSVDKGIPTVSLGGSAKSYTDLALQESVFKKEKKLKSVDFSGIMLDEKGVVGFTVNLSFDPSIIFYKIGTTTVQ